jgi:hypothetical protein
MLCLRLVLVGVYGHSINEKQGQGPLPIWQPLATSYISYRQSSAFCKMDLKGGVGPNGGIQSIGAM